MSLKKIKILGLFSLLLIADHAIASTSSPDMTVYALKGSLGSVWNNITNKAEYLLSYNVTVNNNSKLTFTPGGDNKLCFYLDDNKGNTLMGHGAQLELLSPYTPGGSHDGMVFFSSPDPDLLNLPYVKLAFGKQCPAVALKD